MCHTLGLHSKKHCCKANPPKPGLRIQSRLICAVPQDTYKKVLAKIHSSVIPHMSEPVLLADFLTHSLDKGGLVGMLALNGLFLLVTRHGLEYPGFYQRLYGLITAEAFVAKHRAQFFQLADIFLASGDALSLYISGTPGIEVS